MAHLTASTSEIFVDYQKSDPGQMRYRLAQQNMKKLHQLDVPKVTLDVASGNGLIAEFLLRQGHIVTLFDSDGEMLKQARSRLSTSNLLSQCNLLEGDLNDISLRLPSDHFDLIVAHHILEYLPDVPLVMKSLYTLSKKEGELSLITLNPVSEVIRAIIFQKNAALAQSKLRDFSFDAKWFGDATLYPIEQILAWAADAGWIFRDFRGIRVLSDYMDVHLIDTEKDNLFALEEEMAGLEPYRRFGRYLQFAFYKPM